MKTTISLKSQMAAVTLAKRHAELLGPSRAIADLQKGHLDAVMNTLVWLERNRDRIASLLAIGDDTGGDET